MDLGQTGLLWSVGLRGGEKAASLACRAAAGIQTVGISFMFGFV